MRPPSPVAGILAAIVIGALIWASLISIALLTAHLAGTD